MKFGRNPIKDDLVRVTTYRRTDGRTDRQTDGQAENNRAAPTFLGGP